MQKQTFRERADHFWLRVTEGMQIAELWGQFRTDARSSYRLYSQDVNAARDTEVRRGRHFLNMAGQFFWAVMEKLTPARRVLLLVALIFLFVNVESTWQGRTGEVHAFSFGGSFWSALLLLALLIMEVGDRVVMKRDLQ